MAGVKRVQMLKQRLLLRLEEEIFSKAFRLREHQEKRNFSAFCCDVVRKAHVLYGRHGF